MANLLLGVALGLLLVGGAATATGADVACGAGHLALASASRRLAESCAAAGTSTASCCESVIAMVPCVCRVAVQHPDHPVDLSRFLNRFNASQIVALYRSCRRRLRLRGAGVLGTSGCRGVLTGEHSSLITSSVATKSSPLMFGDAHQETNATVQEPVTVQPSSCASTSMASQLVQNCNIGNIRPSRRCCSVVLAVIDDQDTGCLCMVVEEGEFTISYLSVPTIWGYYRACGGRQQRPPKDTHECEHAPAPAPPPPPPPPPPAPSSPRPPKSPPQPRKRPSKAAPPTLTAIALGLLIFGGIISLLSLAVLAVMVAKKTKEGLSVIPPIPEQYWLSLQLARVAAVAPAVQAAAPVDAEAGQEQQRAVAEPPPTPLFAPKPMVTKEGEAPPAPPFIPLRPPLPLEVPTGAESITVRNGGAA